MRPLAVLTLAGLVTVFGLAAAPAPARAMAPAYLDPAPWAIGVSVKVIVRILEFVDWATEEVRDQVDRRRRYDPPPPLVTPSLDAVASGGTTTAPGDAVTARRARGGMIP
jgi:hypothetical protein